MSTESALSVDRVVFGPAASVPSVSVRLPHHISLGSLSRGSSLASSGGGSCCSGSTTATIVEGAEARIPLARQDAAKTENGRAGNGGSRLERGLTAEVGEKISNKSFKSSNFVFRLHSGLA